MPDSAFEPFCNTSLFFGRNNNTFLLEVTNTASLKEKRFDAHAKKLTKFTLTLTTDGRQAVPAESLNHKSNLGRESQFPALSVRGSRPDF